MRLAVFFLSLFMSLSLGAQNDSIQLMDSADLELTLDTMLGFWAFNPDTISFHQDRIVALRQGDDTKDLYFYGVIVFSLLLVFFYFGSREIVHSSFKSFVSFQHHVQYSRTDKQNNLIYLLVYYILFIVAFTAVLHFVLHTFFDFQVTVSSLFIVCVLYFVWDYLSNNIYHLFATNSKSIDLVKSVSLAFSPLWTFLIWFALFFVLLSSFAVSKFFAILILLLLAGVMLAKEIRVLQVLWLEKIDIMSLHFFAYLCTFKILPFILLIKVIF
jgi:hypothetical protein